LAGIVQAQAQAGDVKGGLETLAQEHILDNDEKAFALKELVQSFVRAGDERGALALAARQTSPFLKAHALLAVASVKSNQKAPEGVLRLPKRCWTTAGGDRPAGHRDPGIAAVP